MRLGGKQRGKHTLAHTHRERETHAHTNTRTVRDARVTAGRKEAEEEEKDGIMVDHSKSSEIKFFVIFLIRYIM